MAKAVRYHPLFDCDVREAALWYDQRSPGLGDRFIDRVRVCTAEVIAAPDIFAKSASGCRYVRLPKFPYLLLFDIVDHEVLMLGVMHSARSMGNWMQRQSEI